MTGNMRSVVSRELGDGIPPTTITAEGIVRAGRRRVLGRRLGFGGAFLAGIAALTAGILALQPGTGGALPTASPSPSGSGMESPPTPPQEEQPSFPLPDLDWSRDYTWWTLQGNAETAETAILTERLWQWIEAYDGMELRDSVEDGPVTRENFLPFVRSTEPLVADLDPAPGGFGLGPATGYERPVYIWSGGSGYVPGYAWRFDGAGNDARINVTIYPKGSYLPGAKSIETSPGIGDVRHLVAGCEDYRYSSQGRSGKLADFTCDEREGPEGERILIVECMEDAEAEWAREMITAVVYRPDGNAVVVSGRALDGESGEFQTGQGPVLTGDDMADLALSLPALIVK